MGGFGSTDGADVNFIVPEPLAVAEARMGDTNDA